MLSDRHSAPSIVERLGLSGTNLLYRWRRELIGQSGKTAEVLDDRVGQLEADPKRVQQERDILKKRWPFSAAADKRCFHRHRPNRFV